MKWFKRVAIFVVGLVLVLALAAGGAYVYGVRRTPDWLKRPMASAAERAAAAGRVDRKILETLSLVGEMNAAESAGSRPSDLSDKRALATQPSRPLRVDFTEEELNASFQKWDQLYGWTERYKAYVQNPSVVLHDGRLVLAANSKELGTVVSLHFDPKLKKDGQLDLRLAQVLAGRLPIPQAFFEKYRDSAATKVRAALPNLRRKAQMKPDGSANAEAMAAAMGELFLHVLGNEPAEPVIFLPVGQSRSVPVRLTDVSIDDQTKTLSLTVKPLNAAERESLLERIRDGSDKETAMSAAATSPPRANRGS
jgi:hypothetical protein